MPVQHALDPDHPRSGGAQVIDEVGHLLCEFGRVRLPGAQHELHRGVELGSRAQQHRYALLPGDTTHEDHVGSIGVDAVLLEHVGVGVWGVLLGIDPVVDHPHLVRVHRGVGRQHVGLHSVGHRDDRRGAFHGVALAPGRQRVAAAELFGLPRPKRLKRVHGQHVRDAVEQRCQVCGHVGVPGVGVHQVDVAHGGHHRQSRGDRLQRWVGVLQAVPWPVRHRGRPVGALAVHGQVHVLGQLLGQVLHVHAGAAVDLGRVLPRAQCDLESVTCLVGLAHLVTSWFLPTTVTPASETTNPRARS